MKNIPKGIWNPVPLQLSLDKAAGDKPQVPSALYAVPLRNRARRVLNLPGSENRLTLILSLMAVLGLGFAAPTLLDGLLLVIELLPHLSAPAAVPWLTVVYGVLRVAAFLFLTLPLIASLYRISVLMTLAHQQFEDGGEMQKISAGECLYAFTSPKAYGRALYVGLRGLGGLILVVLPPVCVVRLAAWWLPSLAQDLPYMVYVLLWLAHVAVACALVAVAVIPVAKATGLGYFVFANPEVTVRDARRRFRSCRRSAWLPLWLMLGFVGWFFVSLVAVLIPFLLHTLPYVLLSWASYGRFLYDTYPSEGTETANLEDEMKIVPTVVKITEA